jgi:hypothetical protein
MKEWAVPEGGSESFLLLQPDASIATVGLRVVLWDREGGIGEDEVEVKL